MSLERKVTGDKDAHFHLLVTVQVTHLHSKQRFPPTPPPPHHCVMLGKLLGPSQISTTAVFWGAQDLTFKLYLVTGLNLFTQHIKTSDVFRAVS